MRQKKLFLSLVIPIFNESSNLDELCKRVEKICKKCTESYEAIFIDDGSTDDTLLQLKNLSFRYPLKVVSFSRNFGKESALTAGLLHAKGDAVVLMDGDLQHSPEMILEFVAHWRSGVDDVYTVRKSRSDQIFFVKWLSLLYYWIHGKITEVEIPKHAGDFRLLDRKVVDTLNSLEERQRYMKGLYAWVGFSSLGLPYAPASRNSGKSRFNLRSLFKLAVSGITSFSNWPLRLWTFLGFFVAFSSLLYGVWIFIETFVYGIITPGFPTLSICLLFLGGVQLISVGVLGEYVANIFSEIKRRPHYVVKEKFGFDDGNLD